MFPSEFWLDESILNFEKYFKIGKHNSIISFYVIFVFTISNVKFIWRIPEIPKKWDKISLQIQNEIIK